MTVTTAFLIPVYNHHEALEHIIKALQTYEMPCLLVNDGSSLECRNELERLANAYEFVSLIHLPVNKGKGGAVIAGVRHLYRQGFSHAFQIDADGQHDLTRIGAFLETSRQNPNALILGYAQYDESVPSSRLYGRYITHFWVWIETLSLSVKDTMCGFRIYPLTETALLIESEDLGLRMEFDVEIVVRLCWQNVPVVNLPVNVTYPMDGVSHFDVVRDNVRISKTHAKLFLGMLIRFPRLLFRLIKG